MKAAWRYLMFAVIGSVLLLSMAYSREILIGFDRVGAAVFGASSAKTISAHCGEKDPPAGLKYFACWWVCPMTGLLEKDHCINAAKEVSK